MGAPTATWFACHLPFMQAVAADDVAAALADVAVGTPVNEWHGRVGRPRTAPSRRTCPKSLKRKTRRTIGDRRRPRTLLWRRGERSIPHAGDDPRIAPTRFEDWLSRSKSHK